tara:strand:- start:1114 stop:1908 length:795 start_codon:yes stop_codon:yes gene_type:complete
MITIIIVVYKSDRKKLNNILQKLSKDFKIIIIDNSSNYNFDNITINKNVNIVRSSNVGNGAAINKAINICNTSIAIYMDIDVNIQENFINKFLEWSNQIADFSILVPNHGNLLSENKIIEKYDGEASIMLFNLKKIKNKNIFDENYFLYFEEIDLFFRFKKNGLKVFFIKDLVISHQRASSIENETSAISNLRSWHYMWSMFYFYRKNFSYTYALKKTYILLLKDFIILLSSILTFNLENTKFRFYRLYGLITSMMCLKSFLRP